MDPTILGALITTIGGGLVSLFGSYKNGEISERQFDREMRLREAEFQEAIKNTAKQFGLEEKKLRQEWDQFTANLKIQQGQLGLQKESLAHTKYMDIIAPAVERARKSQNLIAGFSNLVKSGQTTAPRVNPVATTTPAAPANPIATPTPTVQQAPTNPVMQGV